MPIPRAVLTALVLAQAATLAEKPAYDGLTSVPTVHSPSQPSEAHRARAVAFTQSDVTELALGSVLDREMKGGDTHGYRIRLEAGQYLRVIVEQKGIDVAVKLIGPDGQQIAEVDSPNGAQGPESVSVIVDVPGEYRLEVRAVEKPVAPGRYAVTVEEIRMAKEEDRHRLAGEEATREARQLRQQGGADSFRKGIEKCEEALRAWRSIGDQRREAEALYLMGTMLWRLGEYPKSLEVLQQALPLQRTTGDRQGEGGTLDNLGSVYQLMGQMPKALDYYDQALALRRAVGDRRGEASTLSNIGLVYSSLGQPQKALDYHGQSLPIRREVGDQQGEAETFNNIGAVYDNLGEAQKSLDYYGQALAIRQATGDRRGEAQTLSNMAVVYKYLGEFQTALEHGVRALPIRRAVGDRRGEGYTLHNLGGIYKELGEAQQALEYYVQALSIWRLIGEPRAEAGTLHSMGNIYNERGQPQEALERYEPALRLWQAVGERQREALILQSMGRAYARLSEPRKALEYYDRALPLSRAVGDRREESYILQGIGSIHEESGEMSKALDHYRQALALRRAVGDRIGEASALLGIARVERDRSNLAEARAHSEAALTVVESLRGKITREELRASYLASQQSLYEFQVDLLMQLNQREPTAGHNAAALRVNERARARSLLDMLVEARTDIRQGVDPTLLESERRLQRQLYAKERPRAEALSRQPTDAQRAAIEREMNDLLTEYEEVRAQIRTRSPRYAALMQPLTVGVEEIQQRVLDENTLMLEYALGEKRSHLWAVTSTSMNSFQLPSRAEIETAARSAYELLLVSHRTGAKRQMQRAVAELSQIVLGPVAGQLGTKRLVIVADGALQYMPFGALSKPDGRLQTSGARPLILDHEIISLPSASVLAVLRRELARRGTAPRSVAILADPVFDQDDPRVKAQLTRPEGANTRPAGDQRPAALTLAKAPRPGADQLTRSAAESGVTSLDRLPFTRQEAEGIASLVPVGSELKAVDFEASREMAMSAELRQYRLVHFATHALVNSQHPGLSGIVLSLVDRDGQPRDGFLRLYDIYNLELGADLVVLSACRTALGKEVKGEGLVGITRGFMYAGAPRVVASLWDVRDKATAGLMRRFYAGMLRDGLRPAAALRAAQVSLFREKRWEAPYYWAGFVFQGEWR